MVQKFSGIVKRQLDYWKYQVAHYGPDHPRFRPTKIAKYQHLINEFSALADYLDLLEQQESVDIPAAPERAVDAYFRTKKGLVVVEAKVPSASAETGFPDDLADLPPELLNELSESIKGETDPLIKIINARGGTATLDEILIDLYRKYNEVGKRVIVSNKLYRLSKRGLCHALPGKKGVYTTKKPMGGDDAPPSEDDGTEPQAEPFSTGASGAPTKSASKISSKARRDLFASTAIPMVPPIARLSER